MVLHPHTAASILAIASVALSASAASAQVVVDPATGNTYQRIEGPLIWPQARDAAWLAVRNGISGHLATVTSAAERDFLRSAFGEVSLRGLWLGGQQGARADEPAGGWSWITGEVWQFEDWAPGQPSDSCGGAGEDALQWGAGDVSGWNDAAAAGDCGDDAAGYLVEWSCRPIVQGPPLVGACPGVAVTVSVSTSVPGEYGYQWQLREVDGVWTPLETGSNELPCGGNVQTVGEIGRFLTLRVAPCASVVDYELRCLVSTHCGTTESRIATYSMLPCPCPSDWDNSGGVDGDDIGAFFIDWTAGAADIDRSGGTDGDDITFFFERWQAGC